MTDRGYQNIMALVNAMQQRGYKLKKTKAYSDAKRGILRVQDDGTITGTDAKAYELTLSLGRDSTPSLTVLEAVETKTELETEQLRLKNQKLQFEMDREAGKYMLKESFRLEMVSRAAVMEIGFKNLIHTRAGEWTRLVGGKSEKTGILIDVLNHEVDNLMNDFSEMRNFRLVFEEDFEEEADEHSITN
jgi:hypothetical protein